MALPVRREMCRVHARFAASESPPARRFSPRAAIHHHRPTFPCLCMAGGSHRRGGGGSASGRSHVISASDVTAALAANSHFADSLTLDARVRTMCSSEDYSHCTFAHLCLYSLLGIYIFLTLSVKNKRKYLPHSHAQGYKYIHTHIYRERQIAVYPHVHMYI